MKRENYKRVEYYSNEGSVFGLIVGETPNKKKWKVIPDIDLLGNVNWPKTRCNIINKNERN